MRILKYLKLYQPALLIVVALTTVAILLAITGATQKQEVSAVATTKASVVSPKSESKSSEVKILKTGKASKKIVSSKPRTCPGGYHVSRQDPTICEANKHPEPFWEIELRQREWISGRSAPFETVHPGAYANAIEQRKQLAQKPPKVNGTEGVWQPYGHGPLIANSELFPSTNGLGLVHNAGRIDNFAYDAASGRLFATKGTGGIWLSENLGETWRSIGDALPSQIIGAVAWSPANGGTLIALSGDPALGSYTYTGFGAFYSKDLGTTWVKAQGLPDGAPGFAVRVDPQIPTVVYAATLFGLYRSSDAGASYTNVNLPTGDCAGVAGGSTGRPECHVANVVTDVIIK
jgi:hypothetical protein